MLSPRNLRLVIPIIALITVIGLVITSYGSINDLIQKVKEKTADSVPFSNTEVQDPKNTLQGKPHSGTEAPYSSDKVAGDAAKSPEKPKPNNNNKPAVVADTSKSEKTLANQNGKDTKKTGEKSDSKADTKALEDESFGSSAKDPNCKDREYVVMIDAGSTGSRVHVYEFDTCVSPPGLVNEVFKMKKPGLSSFDTDAVGAAASLDELLDEAVKTVPKEKQKCTPVAVKATAGLRMLGEEKSDKILKQVRTHLEEEYPFAVVEGDGISIMDGAEEGVYAWVTTNYLLGNIGSAEKTPTAAVFDLGGGSTQIVFEPSLNDKMVDGDHKYSLSFGNRDFTLYQHSHLGYGLMAGRNKINGLIIESALKSNTELKESKVDNKAELEDKKASITLQNPCIPPGVTASDVQVEYDDGFYLVNMKGPSPDTEVHTGAQCRFLAESVLNKDLECNEKPCSFNGIYQPSLTKSFEKDREMFVFSYFYDRTNPLGFPSSFTVEELTELAKVVCGGESFWSDVLLDDHVKELNEEPQWCMDLSFITAMLHTGYEIPLSRELRTAKTIDNNELGWCLGASLPLLDKSNGWTCRIEDVSE